MTFVLCRPLPFACVHHLSKVLMCVETTKGRALSQSAEEAQGCQCRRQWTTGTLRWAAGGHLLEMTFLKHSLGAERMPNCACPGAISRRLRNVVPPEQLPSPCYKGGRSESITHIVAFLGRISLHRLTDSKHRAGSAMV